MLAGPLAGATGMRPLTFMTANLVGAVLFVPYALAMGYAVGSGLDAVGSPLRTCIRVTWWCVPLGVAALALVVAVTLVLARRRGRSGGVAGAP